MSMWDGEGRGFHGFLKFLLVPYHSISDNLKPEPSLDCSGIKSYEI